MYPALEDLRIPEGIGPISVVRARQSPNGSPPRAATKNAEDKAPELRS